MRSRIFNLRRRPRPRIQRGLMKPIKTEIENIDKPVCPDWLWRETKEVNPYLVEGQFVYKLAYQSETQAEYLANLKAHDYFGIYCHLATRWNVNVFAL